MTTRDRILAYVKDCKHSPTIREIGRHVGRAPSTVAAHLDALERDGLIVRYGKQRRIYSSHIKAQLADFKGFDPTTADRRRRFLDKQRQDRYGKGEAA